MNEKSLKNLMSPEELNARLTPEQRKKNTSKAGTSSGFARGFKGTVKRKFKENPELFGEILDTVIEEAVEGHNLKAVEMLIDLMGESAQRDNIKIKQKELKLKEKALESEFSKDNDIHITIEAASVSDASEDGDE